MQTIKCCLEYSESYGKISEISATIEDLSECNLSANNCSVGWKDRAPRCLIAKKSIILIMRYPRAHIFLCISPN